MSWSAFFTYCVCLWFISYSQHHLRTFVTDVHTKPTKPDSKRYSWRFLRHLPSSLFVLSPCEVMYRALVGFHINIYKMFWFKINSNQTFLRFQISPLSRKRGIPRFYYIHGIVNKFVLNSYQLFSKWKSFRVLGLFASFFGAFVGSGNQSPV